MTNTTGNYDFSSIESKWQTYWAEHKTFKTHDHNDKPKYYVLDMFPYPSGDGLHVGHPEGYTATDIIARYKRMQGYNVLHPMGWDAFGLPAEQHAIRTGTHPKETTQKNITNFRRQIQTIGLSYDWDREIDTTSPSYYKWTQWIFLKLFEKGLAYQANQTVNWCPNLGTVLANEEVKDGVSEVGGHPVEKKEMKQWLLKITEYADRLLGDLDELDWPESVKEMQRNWIGKSTGAKVIFTVKGIANLDFEVFTTRPDTLFGATFCVIAPEHPLVSQITTDKNKSEVKKYIESAAKKTEIDRGDTTKEKTGVFTGSYAINPVNNEEIPIYIADYVMMGYGTGAIMAVPGHDERDHEFAKKYNLKIIRVISGGEAEISEQAHTGDGTLVNSDFLNDLTKDDATIKICDYIEKQGIGKRSITYKLRDWLFCRQRYWGEPFPLAYDQSGNVVPVSEEELPVLLPDLESFKPTGTEEPPLAKATEWIRYEKNGKIFSREINTMPQWAGSCWYYLRYIDPNNDIEAWSKEKEKYWMPVDLYIGGVEHAVLHLLYARFWHKVLYDLNLVSTKEPFKKLVNQGMILGSNNEKMSKSRGNVVNPDHVIEEWGADSLRLYEMFMGPLDQVKPWQTNGIVGVHRFLKRVWRLAIDDSGNLSSILSDNESESMKKSLHRTIKKVGEDIEALRFNTAISAMMEFVNCAYKENCLSKQALEKFILILSPYAPHICEEIWQMLGNTSSLAYAEWPKFDAEYAKEDIIIMSVMVNGKMRGTIEVEQDVTKNDAIAKAKALETVARLLEGKAIKKEIFVPTKIVNFVI
ncbi:MAG: leucine--tRNA ligase [Bdellovibrionota bacterium]